MAKAQISKMDEEERKWRAEDDARTLIRAEEVKADKGRLKAALKILKEQQSQNKAVIQANS